MDISNTLLEKINGYFNENRDNIKEDIFKLVRVPSVTQFSAPPNPYGEDCTKMLNIATELFAERGFEMHNFENYAITARMGPEGDEIGFGAHLDVVPAIEENWKYCKPYEPILDENGYLIGRGVIDDKGPAIISMYVALCIKELGIPMKHAIKIIMGVNEEKGSNDMDYYVKQEKPPVFNIVPDGDFPVTNGEKGMIFLNLKSPVVEGNIIEAGGGTVSNMVADSAYVVLSDKTAESLPTLPNGFTAENTSAGVKIIATGAAAHAATPEKGINAIGLLFTYLLANNLVTGTQQGVAKAIIGICSDCHGKAFNVPLEDAPSGKLTHVLGVLKLDEGQFKLECNMRYPVTIDDEAMVVSIREAVANYGLEVGFLKNVKPAYVPADKPVVQMLMKAYQTICTEDKSEPTISGGGTYARVLPNAVAFGAQFPNASHPFGDERGGVHQPDECVKLDDLLKAGVIYTCAVIMADEVL